MSTINDCEDNGFLKSVNFMVGRFQPLTMGHIKCCETGYKMNGKPTVLCMIDSKVITINKPFPTYSLYLIYKNFIKTYHPLGIEDIILIKSANIIHVSQQLTKNGYFGDIWLCGSDRVTSYRTMHQNYKDKCLLDKSSNVIEIRRSEKDISATKIRESLKAYDFKRFCDETPFYYYGGEEYAIFIYNQLRKFLTSSSQSI